MFRTTLARTALVLGLVLPLGSTLVACGGAQTDAKMAQVQAGTMPEGGAWEGVYYNQTYGFLHITVQSGAVQGAWRTTAGDKWGELYGEVEGDLLRFSWTEHKIGVVGPQAKSEGKGYFLYRIPKEGEAHALEGEWGLGESDAGHDWDCVKQTNQEPDPKSVRPDEFEARVGAEGFDGSKGDSKDAPVEEAKPEGEAPAEGAEAAPAEEPKSKKKK